MTTSLHPRICTKQTFEISPSPEEEVSYDMFQRPQNVGFIECIYPLPLLAKKIGGEEYLTPSLKAAAQAKQVLNIQTLLPHSLLPCYSPTISFLEKIAKHYEQKYQITIVLLPMSEGSSYLLEQEKREGPFSIGLVLYTEHQFHVTPILLHKTKEQIYSICIMDCISSSHILQTHFKDLLPSPQEGRSVWVSKGARLADKYSCRLESMSLLKYLLLWVQRNPETPWWKQVKRVVDSQGLPDVHSFYIPAIWALASQSTRHIVQPYHPTTTLVNNKRATYQQWIQKYKVPIKAHTTLVNPATAETVENTYSVTINLFLVQKSHKYVQKILQNG